MADKFEYKYSAPTQEERKEIDSIRTKYLPQQKTDSKLDRLRKLDRKVKNISESVGISLGVIGLLLFGTGMCFFLEWTNIWYIGIPFSIVGIVIISITYYIYKITLNKLKNKYKEEIIELSNELLSEE